jgi:hypothetical protein
MAVRERINKGDLVEVRPLEKDRHGPGDFGTLRAVALEAVTNGGPAGFRVEITIGQKEPVEVRLNVNDVDVRLLFSARVARGA